MPAPSHTTGPEAQPDGAVEDVLLRLAPYGYDGHALCEALGRPERLVALWARPAGPRHAQVGKGTVLESTGGWHGGASRRRRTP